MYFNTSTSYLKGNINYCDIITGMSCLKPFINWQDVSDSVLVFNF